MPVVDHAQVDGGLKNRGGALDQRIVRLQTLQQFCKMVEVDGAVTLGEDLVAVAIVPLDQGRGQGQGWRNFLHEEVQRLSQGVGCARYQLHLGHIHDRDTMGQRVGLGLVGIGRGEHQGKPLGSCELADPVDVIVVRSVQRVLQRLIGHVVGGVVTELVCILQHAHQAHGHVEDVHPAPALRVGIPERLLHPREAHNASGAVVGEAAAQARTVVVEDERVMACGKHLHTPGDEVGERCRIAHVPLGLAPGIHLFAIGSKGVEILVVLHVVYSRRSPPLPQKQLSYTVTPAI